MSAPEGTPFRTVAFGDVEGGLWGAAVALGPSAMVIGAHDVAEAVAEPAWSIDGDAWTVDGEGIALRVEPLAAPASEQDGASDQGSPPGRGGRSAGPPGGRQHLCRVRGQVTVGGAERAIDCSGTRCEIEGVAPDAFASARAVSGWFGADEALTLVALRSRRATDQESDLMAATLFDPDGWVPVSDPRLSTTYTDAGDPTRASLELWIVDGENEFARRAAGETSAPPVGAQAGGLELRVAPLRCHSRGLEGAGVYLLATL